MSAGCARRSRRTAGAAAAATELRLRTAKLGAAPDDRLRLRIVNAEADRRDEQRTTTPGGTARQRYARVTHLQTAPTPGAHLERTTHDHHDDHRADHDDHRADHDDHRADHDEPGDRPGDGHGDSPLDAG